MAKFSIHEEMKCREMFLNGATSKEVQDHLMSTYSCKRSATSNFIKLVRKGMGIYKSKSN